MKKLLTGLAAALITMPTLAELVRFEVVEIESPAFDGRSFGSVGQYEMITARATFAVDPEHALNAGIVDIDLVPTNASGRVEAIADVAILRPVDLSKGSGRLFYEVLNRGDKISFILMNDAPWVGYYHGLDVANGHLMNEGYTVVWSGWQGDMPAGKNRMTLQAPVVENVTGTVRDEFIFYHNYDPFVATLSYPAASLDTDKATLTVRARQTDPRVTPDDLTFEFFMAARAGIEPYTNEQIVIHRPAGFDANAIYEFTYEARDPIVMGLAFATVRDLISFLRYEPEDDAGNANPLLLDGKPATQTTYGMGISQSGRFVRDFLYQGFNEDEQGRMVFDGLMPDVAGSRKTWTNYRFAQPGRYSQEHEAHLQPGDQFPFTYGVMKDSLTGKTDGILKRCLESDTCPKVIHTDTATEFWQARASLVVTDTTGKDIELPHNVRAYLMASTPHSEGFGGDPYPLEYCQNLGSPLQNGGPMRALLHALDLWVREGVEPPDSEFPSHADGTLVPPDQESAGFPSIPGVSFPDVINGLRATDYSKFPPNEGSPYPVYVPKVDEDGNDIAGIRLPDVSVPLATYMGWNLGSKGFAEGSLCSVIGSTIPFRVTKSDRQRLKDPRLSIEERYANHEAYVKQVEAAAKRLVEKRLLLEDDVKLYVELARKRDIGIE
ncbi:MAG: hypothetical protein IIA07_11685 [Proteobacteria bacterium]|nr:hypothetical protein [Pseudomonadota bacterium]